MKRLSMQSDFRGWPVLLAVCLFGAGITPRVDAAVQVRPASSPSANATVQRLQRELHALGANLTSARERHSALEAQVATLEQQNEARQQVLRQRDADIAALQKQIDAVVPRPPAGGA